MLGPAKVFPRGITTTGLAKCDQEGDLGKEGDREGQRGRREEEDGRELVGKTEMERGEGGERRGMRKGGGGEEAGEGRGWLAPGKQLRKLLLR